MSELELRGERKQDAILDGLHELARERYITGETREARGSRSNQGRELIMKVLAESKSSGPRSPVISLTRSKTVPKMRARVYMDQRDCKCEDISNPRHIWRGYYNSLSQHPKGFELLIVLIYYHIVFSTPFI
ncbi:hypothetical protein D3C81_187100 [compost metagenome]